MRWAQCSQCGWGRECEAHEIGDALADGQACSSCRVGTVRISNLDRPQTLGDNKPTHHQEGGCPMEAAQAVDTGWKPTTEEDPK